MSKSPRFPFFPSHTVRVSRYAASECVEYMDRSVELDRPDFFDFAGAHWEIRLDALSRGGDCVEFILRAKVVRGRAENIAISLVWDFPDWTAETYVQMPGAVYAGNRFASRRIGYPPLLTAPEDIGPGVPTIITDVPRLNIGPGESRINLLTGDFATPAVGFYFPASRQGLWFFTDQGTRLGSTGLDLRENATRDEATLSITAPGIREKYTYFIGHMEYRESQDRGATFETGQSVALQGKACSFPCRSISELVARFGREVGPALAKAGAPDELPFSKAWEILEKKYNTANWHEGTGVYASRPLDGQNVSWQMGWIGGLMATLPLLIIGNPLSAERVRKNLDFVFSRGISRSGFFEGMMENGVWTDDSFGKAPGSPRRWHLIRKSADGLYFVLRHLKWMRREQPDLVDPSWELGTRGCAEAFVRLWERYGQLGQFIDLESGDLLVGGSTAASLAPAALALAAEYFDEPSWLSVADRIATHFQENYVRQGLTTGGPGEALQCPDSESAAGLVESFTTLFEQTNAKKWLDAAEEAACLAATWVMSYDYRFPVASTFGSLDIRTTGTVFANVQNKHSAPGFCTISGDAYWRLFRATGKRFYLDLARQVVRALPQFLSREDKPISTPEGFSEPGWICERVNTSDWLEPVGEIFHGSCWSEVSLMLGILDFPSIYAQPDSGLICCFDQVEARWERLNGDESVLVVQNSTAFDADLTIFVENSEDTFVGLSADWRERSARLSVASGTSARLVLAAAFPPVPQEA